MCENEDFEKKEYVDKFDEFRVVDSVGSTVMMLSALLKKPPNEVSFFLNLFIRNPLLSLNRNFYD